MKKRNPQMIYWVHFFDPSNEALILNLNIFLKIALTNSKGCNYNSYNDIGGYGRFIIDFDVTTIVTLKIFINI